MRIRAIIWGLAALAVFSSCAKDAKFLCQKH